MRVICSVIIGFLFLSNTTLGQIGDNYLVGNRVYNANSTIDTKFFQPEFLEKLIIQNINKVRTERGFEPYERNTILYQSAKLQSEYMAEVEERTEDNKNKKLANTSLRLQHFGGSGIGVEILEKESFKKRGIYYTYGQLAENIAFGWFNSKRESKHLYSNDYTYADIAVSIDSKKRKVYISFILGTFLSENSGKEIAAKTESHITQPALLPWKRLSNYESRTCRKIDRLENISLLQSALTINDNNEVYLEFDDARKFKRFLRERKDGIALDILTADQYECGSPNKVDFSLVNRGARLNAVYTNQFWRKNQVTGKYARSIKVPLGQIPEAIASSDYELNLLLIQDNHVCKSIPASYLSSCEGQYKQTLDVLADTVTINSHFNYKPKADSTELRFRIPFEKKKYTYKTEDIEPFLKLLNEPDFIIYELNISAYSSIEGVQDENQMLQKKRAESIIHALRKRQKDSIISQIKTEAAWEQFKLDIRPTQHNVLASMELKEAQEYIRKYNLSKKLEPILKNHRYAQIDMKVTYDISGAKEQNFVVSKFNKAIEDKNLPLALSIQKYIMGNVMNGAYSMAAVFEQNIPEKTQFVGLLMNKLWLEMKGTNGSLRDYKERIAALNKLDRYNEYVAFNHALCQVKFETLRDERQINDLQNDIDRFYYKSFTKETIDNLNMRFQFKVINMADSLDNKENIVEERLKKIKEIVDIKDESIENSLRLAELFIQNKDYEFALKMLEVFVENTNAPEELVYTYLSLCSRFEAKMLSRKFARVMNIAKQLNPDRYCSLFDGNHFSLRVFENPLIKNNFCEECSEPRITKQTE